MTEQLPIQKDNIVNFALTLADSTLIMSQRLGEWTGHGPALEQDIAMTNIALDYLGQSRNFFQYIANLKDDGATEDSIAYLRDAHQYRNHLLVELPNGDWAQSILKIFFFAAYQRPLYLQLLQDSDVQFAAIAEKSLKEVSYHLKWSSDWVIRLGDGTEESNERMNNAIAYLWNYTGELFEEIPGGMGVTDQALLKNLWLENVKSVFEKAALTLPAVLPFQTGGLRGIHTEHLGYILADMQYLQRVYPNSEW
jgi:ring-1,2-phenylacetyl-CoA epoxidase subunit PaaC